MRKQIMLLLVGLFLITAAQAQTEKEAAKSKKTAKNAPAEPPSLTKTYLEEEVEVLPQFQGGQQALLDFLAKAVIIPEFATRNLLAAAVDVGFVLTSDGQMDSVMVTNGACCGFDEEALRVAKLTAGKWTPGTIQGTAVRTRVDLPVVFRVQFKNSSSPKRMQEMAAEFEKYKRTGEYVQDQKTYEKKIAAQKL